MVRQSLAPGAHDSDSARAPAFLSPDPTLSSSAPAAHPDANQLGEAPPSCDRPTGWARFGCDSRTLGRRLALREPGDVGRALTVMGVTGLLYAGRESIRREVLEHRSPARTRLYEAGRNLSKGAVSPILAGAFLAADRLSGNREYGETAQILLESTLYSAALAGGGSFVLAAQRPEEGDSVRAFHSGGHGVSLDVALAASIAAPLDRRHLRFRAGDGRLARVLKVTGRSVLYSAVALTAFQRMDADKHWAPDVFLGAVAGLAAGYSLCSAHDRSGGGGRDVAPEDRNGPSAALFPGGAGLAWSF